MMPERESTGRHRLGRDVNGEARGWPAMRSWSTGWKLATAIGTLLALGFAGAVYLFSHFASKAEALESAEEHREERRQHAADHDAIVEVRAQMGIVVPLLQQIANKLGVAQQSVPATTPSTMSERSQPAQRAP